MHHPQFFLVFSNSSQFLSSSEFLLLLFFCLFICFIFTFLIQASLQTSRRKIHLEDFLSHCYRWHTLWFISLQQNSSLLFYTFPQPHASHTEKRLHIQFADIPFVHALAPLQKKYMYRWYLYPSVNCWNEFCTSTIKDCQKAMFSVVVFFQAGVSGALMRLQMSSQISSAIVLHLWDSREMVSVCEYVCV